MVNKSPMRGGANTLIESDAERRLRLLTQHIKKVKGDSFVNAIPPMLGVQDIPDVPDSFDRPQTQQSIARKAQIAGVDVPQEDIDAYRSTLPDERSNPLGKLASAINEPIRALGAGLVQSTAEAATMSTAADLASVPSAFLPDEIAKQKEELTESLNENLRLQESVKTFLDTYQNTEGPRSARFAAGTAASRELYPEIPDIIYLGAEIFIEELGLLALSGGGSGLLTGAKALKVTAQALSKYDPAALKALGLFVNSSGAVLEVTGTAAKAPLRFENWAGQQGIDLAVGTVKGINRAIRMSPGGPNPEQAGFYSGPEAQAADAADAAGAPDAADGMPEPTPFKSLKEIGFSTTVKVDGLTARLSAPKFGDEAPVGSDLIATILQDDLAGVGEVLKINTVTQGMVNRAKTQIAAVTREALERRELPDEFMVYRIGEVYDGPMPTSLSPDVVQVMFRAKSRTGTVGATERFAPIIKAYKVTKDDVLADVDALIGIKDSIVRGYDEEELLIDGSVLKRKEVSVIEGQPRVKDIQQTSEDIEKDRLIAEFRNEAVGSVDANSSPTTTTYYQDTSLSELDDVLDEPAASLEVAEEIKRKASLPGEENQYRLLLQGSNFFNLLSTHGLPNFYRHAVPVATGKEAFIERLRLESRFNRISEEMADNSEKWISLLPEEYLERLATSFVSSITRQADSGRVGEPDSVGVAGRYWRGPSAYGSENTELPALVTISKQMARQIDDNPYASRASEEVIFHEVSHHLEQFIPLEDIRKLFFQWQRDLKDKGLDVIETATKAREAFAASKIPTIRGKRITADRAALLRVEDPDAFYALELEILERKRISKENIIASENAYRYEGGFSEWIAEILKDKATRTVFLINNPDKKNIIQKIIDVIHEMARATRAFFLRENPDYAEGIYNNLMSGNYSAIKPTFHSDKGFFDQFLNVPDSEIARRPDPTRYRSPEERMSYYDPDYEGGNYDAWEEEDFGQFSAMWIDTLPEVGSEHYYQPSTSPGRDIRIVEFEFNNNDFNESVVTIINIELNPNTKQYQVVPGAKVEKLSFESFREKTSKVMQEETRKKGTIGIYTNPDGEKILVRIEEIDGLDAYNTFTVVPVTKNGTLVTGAKKFTKTIQEQEFEATPLGITGTPDNPAKAIPTALSDAPLVKPLAPMEGIEVKKSAGYLEYSYGGITGEITKNHMLGMWHISIPTVQGAAKANLPISRGGVSAALRKDAIVTFKKLVDDFLAKDATPATTPATAADASSAIPTPDAAAAPTPVAAEVYKAGEIVYIPQHSQPGIPSSPFKIRKVLAESRTEKGNEFALDRKSGSILLQPAFTRPDGTVGLRRRGDRYGKFDLGDYLVNPSDIGRTPYRDAAPATPTPGAAGAATKPPSNVIPEPALDATPPTVLEENLELVAAREEMPLEKGTLPSTGQPALKETLAPNGEEFLRYEGVANVPIAVRPIKTPRGYALWDIEKKFQMPGVVKDLQGIIKRADTENQVRLDNATPMPKSAPDKLKTRHKRTPATPKPIIESPAQAEDIINIDEAPDFLARVVASKLPGEKLSQTALGLHETAIAFGQRQGQRIVNSGNNKLLAKGIGIKKGVQVIMRDEDKVVLDELYSALHSPSKVESGEIVIPENLREIYDELRDATDWEERARIKFDPRISTVDDYFARGWKTPDDAFIKSPSGGLISNPGFKKHRVDATYEEMRELGYEPAHWNPYEQFRQSFLEAARYRQQRELIKALEQIGGEEMIRKQLVDEYGNTTTPDKWRVPDVGGAFQGNTTKNANAYIVPDQIARLLENLYGKRPQLPSIYTPSSLGSVLGDREINLAKYLDWVSFIPKKAKLFGSFFQQQDFLLRSGIGAWQGFVDGMFRGAPIDAIASLAKYPRSVQRILHANFSPTVRRNLLDLLDNEDVIIKEHPGVTLKSISDGGLSHRDVTIFSPDTVDLLKKEANRNGLSRILSIKDGIAGIDDAMRRGLFDGVYPAAIIEDIRNNIAPSMVHLYGGKLTDAQLSRKIALAANTKYSTIPRSQALIQNHVIYDIMTRVFFSMGESEGLLKQAYGSGFGDNRAFWMQHWLAAYLAVISTASVIHWASTGGEPLPKDRYIPMAKVHSGGIPMPSSILGHKTPFPQENDKDQVYGYNSDFASPNLPVTGRHGTALLLDIVSQMDTAFRVLDPASFISSRFNVGIRTAVNQVKGETFTGESLEGFGQRAVQTAIDMFAPIGAGSSALELSKEYIPGADDLIPAQEPRIGLIGQFLQMFGNNVKARPSEQLIIETLNGLGATQPGGEPLTAYANISLSQMQMLENEAPGIHAELVTRDEESAAKGNEAAVRRIVARTINEERINKEQALSDALTNGTLTGDTRLEQMQSFNKLYADAQRQSVFMKQGVYALYDLEEEREITDPYKKALDNFYKTYENATDAKGELDYDKLEKSQLDLKEKSTDLEWTYIQENSGLTSHPSFIIQKYLKDRELVIASGYWDMDDDQKTALREQNPLIDIALVYWRGYQPKTYEAEEMLQRL